WAYDAGKNAWQKMDPPAEPPGWGNRRRILVAVPDQNVVLMEDFINPSDGVPGKEGRQQIWTYRYADAPREADPLPPGDLRVSTTRDGAALAWKPSPSAGVTGYVIRRGEGATPWRAEFREAGRVGRAETSFRDGGLRPGAVYFYQVQALAGGKAS